MDNKDIILYNVTMKEICNKYGIKVKNKMCSCPFHKDNSPSMKIYENSFYCFSCNRTGDLIEFVENMFNLSFIEAMQKINDDFNLKINFNSKIDKNKLMQIKKEHELKLQQQKTKKEKREKTLITICNRIYIYNKIIKNMKEQISKENWEEQIELVSFLQNKVEQLEDCFEDIIKARD